jgi:hypothetical protein
MVTEASSHGELIYINFHHHPFHLLHSNHNYLLWRAQIMPPIQAARYEDLLLGIEKAPSKTISV